MITFDKTPAAQDVLNETQTFLMLEQLVKEQFGEDAAQILKGRARIDQRDIQLMDVKLMCDVTWSHRRALMDMIKDYKTWRNKTATNDNWQKGYHLIEDSIRRCNIGNFYRLYARCRRDYWTIQRIYMDKLTNPRTQLYIDKF